MNTKQVAGVFYSLALICFGVWAGRVEYQIHKQNELTKLVFLIQHDLIEVLGETTKADYSITAEVKPCYSMVETAEVKPWQWEIMQLNKGDTQ